MSVIVIICLSDSALINAEPQLMFDGIIIYVQPKYMSVIVIICLSDSALIYAEPQLMLVESLSMFNPSICLSLS